MEAQSDLTATIENLSSWAKDLCGLEQSELMKHKQDLKMEFRRMLKLKPQMDSASAEICSSFEKLLLEVRSMRDVAMNRAPPKPTTTTTIIPTETEAKSIANSKSESDSISNSNSVQSQMCTFGDDCTSQDPKHFYDFLHLHHPKAKQMIKQYHKITKAKAAKSSKTKPKPKSDDIESESDSNSESESESDDEDSDSDYDENEAKKTLKRKQNNQRKTELLRIEQESMMDEFELKKLRADRLQKLLSKTETYMKRITTRIRRNFKSQETNVTTSTDLNKAGMSCNEIRSFLSGNVSEEAIEQTKSLSCGQLKDYQKIGLRWMVSLYQMRLNGILADEMGLGKTVQVMGLIAYLLDTSDIHGKYLIVCPLSTMSGWKQHFETWLANDVIKVYVHEGDKNQRTDKLLGLQCGKYEFDVVLSTYERVLVDAPLLGNIKWHYLIIDEAHRIKNKSSKLFTCLNSFSTRSRLLLTGTPLQNNLTELWSLLNFILPEIFDSQLTFEDWFCTPFQNKNNANSNTSASTALNDEERMLVMERLHRAIDPFLLRRIKKDVLPDMLDCHEVVIKCPMSGMQHAMYEQLQKYRAFKYISKSNRTTFNNLLMQFRKCAVHPYLFHESEYEITDEIYQCSGKLHLLHGLIPKMKHFGHRMLIFCQFVSSMDIISEYLALIDEPFLRIDGSTPAEERFEILAEFKKSASVINIFLLSTRACGQGLNLFAADTVILFETDWNPQQDCQAMARAHRIGQTKEVRVFRLISKSSVDEIIYDRAQNKLDLERKAIEGGKFDFTLDAQERKQFLKQILQERDLDRNEENDNDSHNHNNNNSSSNSNNNEKRQLNKLFARTEQEFEYFNQMDVENEDSSSSLELLTNQQLPIWLELITTDKDCAAPLPSKRIRRQIKSYNDNDEQWKEIDAQIIVQDEKKKIQQRKRQRQRERQQQQQTKEDIENETDIKEQSESDDETETDNQKENTNTNNNNNNNGQTKRSRKRTFKNISHSISDTDDASSDNQFVQKTKKRKTKSTK